MAETHNQKVLTSNDRRATLQNTSRRRSGNSVGGFFCYADFELGGVKKVLGSFNPHGSQAHDEGELAHAGTIPCADFFPLLESSPGARLSK